MPLGVKPQCLKCGSVETVLWHITAIGNVCNNCLEDERSVNNTGDKSINDDEKNGVNKPGRKSTRVTRYCKPNKSNTTVKFLTKDKGRPHIVKKHVS